METKSTSIEDASFLLFILPIFVSGAYAIYGAVTSSAFTAETYVAVTSNSIVFLIAVVAVCAGTLIELYYSSPDVRSRKLDENARRMQRLAIITLILSLAAALVAIRSASLPLYLGTFLAGRYPILYSALLVSLSFLIVVPVRIGNVGKSAALTALSVILLLAAPIVYFVGSGGSIAFEIRAAGATALLILGLALIVYTNRGLFEKKTV